MYDIARLTLPDVTEMGAHMRSLGRGADSLEMVAALCVQYLREHLIDAVSGEPACALVRFFKTHSYGDLPTPLQAQADETIAERDLLSEHTKCLTLMATVGDRVQWCDRTASQGHQAIPLTSETAVGQIPMISQLIQSFGLAVSSVLTPDLNLLIELERKTCNVFYVPDALGSEYIPAQASFVEPYGIKSVIGFGGVLPSGDLFAVILFSKVAVPEETARLLRTLPLNIKMAIVPFLKKNSFRALQSV